MINFKKSYVSKILSAVMSLTIVCAGVATAAYSAGADSAVTPDVKEEQGVTQSAASSDSSGEGMSKNETVYVIADADGTPSKVIVSDWIRNSSASDIIKDVSTLKGIENVKGDEGYTIDESNMYEWQANGSDIYYQGTSDKPLPVGLKITYTLDGKQVSPDELAGKSGNLKMRFDYENRQYQKKKIDGKDEKIYVPFVMLTGMIVDNDNFRNVEVSNGKIINDGARTYVIGFALPGMQENLGIDKKDFEIPSYVEISADVSDFELSTTLTLAANDMFSDMDFSEIDGKVDELSSSLNELETACNDLIDGSSQIYDGISTLLDKSGELIDGINQIYDGADKINSGAAELDSGAKTLEDGAKTLDNGISELSNGAKTLDGGVSELANGAKALDDGVSELAGGAKTLDGGISEVAGGAKALDDGAGSLLGGANQLSGGVYELQGYIGTLSSGLNDLSTNSASLVQGAETVFNTLLSTADKQIASAGLSADKLSISNYASVLSALIDSLSDDNAQALAYNTALKTVTATVESQRSVISSGVEAAVRKQVTEGVLAAAGYTMTAEQYEAAVAAGNIPAEVQLQVSQAVSVQMSSEAIKETISTKTEEKISSLIEENMNSAEVQGQIADAVKKAQAGRESLTALKQQLDSYNEFYLGVKTYTAGVDQANAGAKQILSGTDTLKAGVDSLSSGASQLKDGADSLSSGTTQLKGGSASLVNGVSQLKTGSSSLTSGASELKDGSGSLVGGASQLKDGSGALASGAGDLSDGTAALKSGAQTLFDGIAELKNGSSPLTEGIKQLKDGSMQLTDGLKKFKKEGIQVLVNAVNGDVKAIFNRLKAVSEVSATYKSFSGISDDMDGKTDFIYKTASIEKQ